MEDLLARMTLEEKVAQMLSIWDAKVEVFDAKLRVRCRRKWRKNIPDGIGQFARPSDATGPASPRLVPGRDVRATDSAGQRPAALCAAAHAARHSHHVP